MYKQKGDSCAAYLFEPVALDTGFDMGRKTDAGRQADHELTVGFDAMYKEHKADWGSIY